MAHVPNGPAVFYRAGEVIYVEDGVQPEGWSDRPEEAPAKRGRKAKADGAETPVEPESEASEAGE